MIIEIDTKDECGWYDPSNQHFTTELFFTRVFI